MKREYQLNRQTAKTVANSFKKNLREQLNCGHSRSKKAALVELSLQLSGFKQMLHDPARLQAALADAAEAAQEPFVLPSDVETHPGVVRIEKAKTPTVLLNAGATSGRVILFLCGGAYFLQPTKDHWHFLMNLADQVDAKIVVPQYPLAPTFHFDQAYAQLRKLYIELYTNHPASQLTLMGDSAGGGLAAGFCEWLAEQGMPQPGKLVLISPWLDLTLTNPLIEKYQANDATLDVIGLRTVGRLWSGNTAVDDYRLSPINGRVDQLKNVLVFAGTREIMFPDCMKFVKKLRQENVNVRSEIGRELYHEYPLTPIPEAQEAIQVIKQFCFN
ncbi:alpha/beta hydrolase [Limosilactobacillus caecicola]|uniref:alpha/beta hydrolase n=1 Tax=Limosilactobacillus caecicola TaxID=2941332 RepID=UPI00203DC66A|nr:alpha/beta hydrolase [Limosilactobacillus caecicola]